MPNNIVIELLFHRKVYVYQLSALCKADIKEHNIRKGGTSKVT